MDNREIMYEKITDILQDNYHPDINTDEEIRKQKLMDYVQQQVSVEPEVIPKIADALHYKMTEYEMWLQLPRYQTEESSEYYADVTAILEDLGKILKFVKSNFTA